MLAILMMLPASSDLFLLRLIRRVYEISKFILQENFAVGGNNLPQINRMLDKKQENSLVMSLSKALKGIPLSLCDKHRWDQAVYPLRWPSVIKQVQ